MKTKHEVKMSTVTTEHSRERWNSLWPEYIKISQRGSSSAIATADAFIKLSKISEGSRVLDAGCGHGRITEMLVRSIRSLEVVGLDMTQELLDSFVIQNGLNDCKLSLKCGDITNLPFDDCSFDTVVSSRAFQYLPDPIIGVREATRVLKPGGTLVIAVPNKLNLLKYITYNQPLYSPFQVRDWFKACALGDIEYRSMCFFPPSLTLKGVGSFMEVAGMIPVVKFFGGNCLVKGIKAG